MKDQAGFSLGGIGGQGGREALQYDAINRSSHPPLEKAGSPLEANVRTLEIVLSHLESRISLLKDKTYPLRSLQETKGSPIPCGPPTAGSSPVSNSLAEFTSRIHSATMSLEELIESLEI